MDLFEGKNTYPKVDIKPRSSASLVSLNETIDRVVDLLKQKQLNFTLLNVSVYNEDCVMVMQAETYLAYRAAHYPTIRLNIDLERYRPTGEKIHDDIKEHVSKLGSFVFSISPEIHSEDGEEIAKFAEEQKIDIVAFWFSKNRPRGYNLVVAEETVRAKLALEEKYPITIYFDINPFYLALTNTGQE